MELIVLIALVGGGILVYRFATADRGGADLAWGGPQPVTGGLVGVGTVEAAGPATYRVAGPSAPWATGTGLARIESARLATSPLLWMGPGLSGLVAVTALDAGLPDQSEWLSLGGRLLPVLTYPLCGMVLLATNRAALRPRRDGLTELFDSLPTTRSTRSLGLFLALRTPVAFGIAVVPVLALCVWFGAGKDGGQSLWARSHLGLPFADLGWSNLAMALVLVACAGALGIGLARLLPWSMVAIVALVLIGIASGLLANDDLPRFVGGLSPAVNTPDLPAFLAPFGGWWHVVYLAGLAAVAVGATFLLDGNRRWGATGLVVAGGLVAIGLTGQQLAFRAGVVDQVADAVTRPDDHQVCTDVGTGAGAVEVCVYEDLEPLARPWLATAAAVRAAAPAEAVDGTFVVRQRVAPEEQAALDPAVRAEIDDRGGAPQPVDEPGLRTDLRWGGDITLRLRALEVAGALVGLPPATGPDDPLCFAGGQARSAVAIALAGRTLPGNGRAAYGAPPADDFVEAGTAVADPELTTFAVDEWEMDTEPVVVHHEDDLVVGRALLALPEDDVRSILARDWARWIDPATPTAELAAAFDLPRPARPSSPSGMAPCR